ncbi:glycolate oxidase [Rhodoligotrophos appendicifer]|uniref:alpha-hydroxy acid oxidase n=1 Tax=Rhodoligotrophos appendicifer TaxID=987056 RepID=UPI0014790A75|nr:alpha-hydroxy acid oxidase [Rhodoligotrophos appendicifer]
MSEFPTLQDIVWAAREKLPRSVWDFVTFGTETETSLRRNRRSLDSLAFVPRVMRDVSEVQPDTCLLGINLRIPVMLAPVGSIALLDPAGAVAAARTAQSFGTVQIVSGFAAPDYATVARECPGPLIYALHPRAEQPFLNELVDGVVAAGYRAIAFVSEAAYYSRRERDLMSQVQTAGKRARSYGSYLAQQRSEGSDGKSPSKEGLLGTMATWEMLQRVKERSGLPVVLKGVTCAADARLAVEHGVDVIYVSNHGGRALDHARGTAQVLPEIVDAAGGKADVIIDGGFVRGTDVLKAVSLGAKAVCMGRMQSWALAAGGPDGLMRMLELLEEEIIIGMGLLGVNRLSELDPSYVEKVEPVVMPHPLSAFPVVMERIAAER